jgi:hypothetical protein
VVQSPYARLTVAVPYLATSSSNSLTTPADALSASMRTASREASPTATTPPPTGSKGNALLAARSGVSGRQELALKPAFDLVWQAAGFAGSRNYNAAAQWAPRRD